MKSFFVTAVLFAALVIALNDQTNAPVPITAAASTTNQPAKATPPYPVKAIVVSNTITFPILLSKTSEPLMTNAVYHRTFGRKVIFAADLSIQSFDIDKLHPSVIAQLDLDPGKVKSDQETLDKQNQEWAVQHQQQNQQILAAEAAALAKNQAASQAGSSNGNPAAPGTAPRHHKQPPQGAPPPAN